MPKSSDGCFALLCLFFLLGKLEISNIDRGCSSRASQLQLPWHFHVIHVKQRPKLDMWLQVTEQHFIIPKLQSTRACCSINLLLMGFKMEVGGILQHPMIQRTQKQENLFLSGPCMVFSHQGLDSKITLAMEHRPFKDMFCIVLCRFWSAQLLPYVAEAIAISTADSVCRLYIRYIQLCGIQFMARL